MSTKAKIEKIKKVSGVILSIEIFNKKLKEAKTSVFAFDFMPNVKGFGKHIRIYVAEYLKMRCAKELQNCDVASLSVRRLGENFRKTEYELIDIIESKRSILSDKQKEELIEIHNTIKKRKEGELTGKQLALNIVRTKRQNRFKQALSKKTSQEGICRFIIFKDIEHVKKNGKYTHHPKFYIRKGLQVENRFYFVDSTNEVRYKYINKSGAKVKQVFENIPEWATAPLIEKYEKILKKFNQEGKIKTES